MMTWFSSRLRPFGVDRGLTFVTFGNLGSAVLGGIFWLVLASLLMAESYGQLNYYLAFTFIFGTVSLLGLNPTVTTYLAKGVEKVRNQSNLLAIISTASFILPLVFITGYMSLGALLVGVSLFQMSLAEMLGRKMYKEYMFMLVGQRAAQIVFGISLYFLYGIDGVILGYTIAFLAFSYRYLVSIKDFRPDFSHIRSNIRFMMHSYAMELARTVSMFSDKLLIAPLFGFAVLGLYQLGAQFLLFLGMVPTIFYHYLLSQEASGVHSKRMGTGAFIVSALLAVAFAAAVPWIINTFFPNFADSILPAQLMCVGIVPMTVSSTISSKFLGRERSRPVFIGAAIYVAIQYATIIVLGNLFGIAGLALSLMIALTAQALYLVVAERMQRRVMEKV